MQPVGQVRNDQITSSLEVFFFQAKKDESKFNCSIYKFSPIQYCDNTLPILMQIYILQLHQINNHMIVWYNFILLYMHVYISEVQNHY